MSVISALPLTGVRIPMMIEGALDSEGLALYVKHFLVPLLPPGDIVLWDQISMHKNPRVKDLIEATGAGVELFPAYSPDFDPIEECISKVKAYLCKCQADSVPALRRALKRAFEQVTPEDIHRWFKHCGFVVT
jgi:transposase